MPVRYGILGGMGPMAAATYTRLLSNQVHTGTEAELVMLNDPRIENQSIMEAGTLIGTALRFNDFMKFTGFEKTSCSSNTWHLVLHINRPPGLISICDATADLIQEKFPGQTVGLLCTTKSAKYAANGGYGSAFDERGIKWGSISDDIQDKTMDAINLIKNPVDGSVSFREARQTILDVMMWHIETNGVTVFGLCCTEIPLVIDQAVVDDYEPMKGRGIAVVSSMDALAARFSAAINERKARLGMEPAA